MSLANLVAGRSSYRIFSNDWHGVDLIEVARAANVPIDQVANHHFYEHLYRKWKTQQFEPEPGWIAGKRKWAETYRDLVLVHAPATSRVLSVGAGLGHVERHMVSLGMHVDLQECQSESLDPSDFPDSRIWVSQDLHPVPDASYDVVLALSLVYVFDEIAYATFLRDCHRVLRPGGLLVVSDHDPSLPLSRVKQWLLNKVKRRRELMWGWLRSPNSHRNTAEQSGFRYLEQRFYDRRYEAIPNPFRVCGLQLPKGPSLGQVLVFRRG